jgi:hypothetical protein
VRILLDESTPRDLRRDFAGHEATTVARLGWSGIANGELLRRAVAAGFDLLVTADQSLQYQQNVPRSGIAVMVLRARSNRLEDYLPLMPAVLQALTRLKPGEVIEVGGPSAR